VWLIFNILFNFAGHSDLDTIARRL